MRWWSVKKEPPISTVGSPILNNVADMFEAGCMSLVLQAMEKGEIVKRFVSQATSSLSTYNNLLSGSSVGMVKAGGRIVFMDEEVETYEKGSLVAWDEGMASLAFDGTNVRVEFVTIDAGLYTRVYANVSGTLHP